MNELEFFDEVIRSVEEDDKGSIRKIKAQLKDKKFTFSFQIHSKAVIPDPNDEWVQLDRSISIKINNSDVYEYSDVHYGYHGGGGSGWFVEEEENSLDENIAEALSYFGIDVPEAIVPKPEELKAELENIMSEIYSKDDVDEDSQEDFDYWLIDNTFVAEPYIGGQQVGEVPDFDISHCSVLNISQDDFDRLMTAYNEIYGQFPDQ